MLISQRGAATAARAGAVIAMFCGVGNLPAAAQDSGAVTVDVARCVELESADARLACFGSEVNAVLEERGTEAGRSSESGDSDVETRAPGRDAGRDARAERIATQARDASVQARSGAVEADDEEYTGTIVEFHERLPNAYVITLDNGQVWLQTEPKQYPLRPGLDVRIYPTAWGEHYRLHGIGTGSHIQVRRVR